jgi:hypothetical protein
MFSQYNLFFHILTFQVIFLLTTELDLFLDTLPLLSHPILWIMFCFYEFIITINDPDNFGDIGGKSFLPSVSYMGWGILGVKSTPAKFILMVESIDLLELVLALLLIGLE